MASFITFLACAVAGALELLAALFLFFKARTGGIRILAAGLLFPPVLIGLMCLYFPLVTFLTRGNPSYLAGDEGWTPILGTLVMFCFTGGLITLSELLLLFNHWEKKSRDSASANDSDNPLT